MWRMENVYNAFVKTEGDYSRFLNSITFLLTQMAQNQFLILRALILLSFE
jgi:hypothetical protein